MIPRGERRRSRPGLTLLEVLVALAILALSAGGWLTLLSQSASTSRTMHDRERETERAALLLSRVAALPPADLAALGGRSRRGGLVLSVRDVTPSLVDLVVLDSAGTKLLLETSVHIHPDSIDADR